mmetsp:Transcript_19806/g.50274  ORF Transcript_19806/g.50274 Transcript_19806/m.50274 type:complete len:307 (+) Transcript_19806:232-1152(+)
MPHPKHQNRLETWCRTAKDLHGETQAPSSAWHGLLKEARGHGRDARCGDGVHLHVSLVRPGSDGGHHHRLQLVDLLLELLLSRCRLCLDLRNLHVAARHVRVERRCQVTQRSLLVVHIALQHVRVLLLQARALGEDIGAPGCVRNVQHVQQGDGSLQGALNVEDHVRDCQPRAWLLGVRHESEHEKLLACLVLVDGLGLVEQARHGAQLSLQALNAGTWDVIHVAAVLLKVGEGSAALTVERLGQSLCILHCSLKPYFHELERALHPPPLTGRPIGTHKALAILPRKLLRVAIRAPRLAPPKEVVV